ncbi:MAG: hypothetical protein NTX82_07765 [Candidatus Parcubacteria bacterium]|nr:hypothetical protein [Candidatus Parcubacteria bacterium]
MSGQILAREDFDTVPGIMAQLTSKGLAGLNNLAHARREAGYDREEPLTDFVIMGRWFMDRCGNTCRYMRECKDSFIPADILNLPMVMTHNDFWAMVKKVKGPGVCCSWSAHDNIPPVTATCPWCNQGWDLHNCHDVYEMCDDVEFPIPYWTGRTLESIKAELQSDPNEIFRFQNEMLLRHPRWIDLTPLPEYESLVVNKNGLVGVEGTRGVNISWDYQVQAGDMLCAYRIRFFHKDCWREYQEKNERAAFTEIFRKAGFQQFNLTATENCYCDCESCAPWYFVDTSIGRFLIGWRKRVISISWEGLHHYNKFDKVLGTKLLKLFTAEDVTKDEIGIHAWGKEKAIEYLSKIRVCLA